MSYQVLTKRVVMSTVSCMPIIPEETFDFEEVKKYIEKHPFPETDAYGVEELLWDVQTSGMWTLGEYVTDEQVKYICTMLGAM